MLISENQTERLDPRVKRTQRYIKEAFTALLEEKGFNAITVREITERAQINRATFYAHYPDKFGLLNETLADIFRQELTQKALNVCQYSPENLRALMLTVCEFIEKSNAQCKMVDSQFELIIEKQVRKQILTLLEHWFEQFEEGHDVKSIAIAACWSIYGLAAQWVQEPDHQPVEDYIDQVLPLFTAYLPF